MRLGLYDMGALLNFAAASVAACVLEFFVTITALAGSTCIGSIASSGSKFFRGLIKILSLMSATNCILAAVIFSSVPEMSSISS